MTNYKGIESEIYKFICKEVELGKIFNRQDIYDKVFKELKYLPDDVDICCSSMAKKGILKSVGTTIYIRMK